MSDLILSRNAFEIFPVAICGLSDLSSSLDLSFNKLEKLPVEIASLTKLNILTLDHNRLISLPDEIGSMIDLGTLNLAHNQIVSLPDSLTKLQNLSTLNVSFNLLVALPESIEKLVRLSALQASHNALASVPSSLAQTPGLTTLDLESNRLTSLPDLSGCAKLKMLNVGDNRLTSPPVLPTDSTVFNSLAIHQNPCLIDDPTLAAWKKLKTLSVYSGQSIHFAEMTAQLLVRLGEAGEITLPDKLNSVFERLETLFIVSDGSEIPRLQKTPAELRREFRKTRYRAFVGPSGVATFSRVQQEQLEYARSVTHSLATPFLVGGADQERYDRTA